MNRREFLQCAALISAGATVVPKGWTLSQDQSRYLAASPPYIEQAAPSFFSVSQRADVRAMADLIIPRTDTPGALDAGADRFIELMVSDWFNEAEQQHFMAGLAEIRDRSGGDFTARTSAQQLALLEALESESADANWYAPFSTMRVWDDSAPFICQLKELAVLGFTLSEVGATQFLRPNPMGSLNGSLPLGPDDPAYDKESMLRSFAGEASQ
ncbi:MAG: gluconate 2-dehydrogenase subunit 3 family protein [Halioglobus sp.]